jgi:hypothetical protein
MWFMPKGKRHEKILVKNWDLNHVFTDFRKHIKRQALKYSNTNPVVTYMLVGGALHPS